MTYTCPVCAYGGMEGPPYDYNICPCCGTEFDYDNHGRSNVELRNVWLAKGGLWFSPVTPPPQGWEPYAQLTAAGYDYGVERRDERIQETSLLIENGGFYALGS
jgi:hypothetical protein